MVINNSGGVISLGPPGGAITAAQDIINKNKNLKKKCFIVSMVNID
tara:strand:- start:11 stop:148 length:138 start_codon:yes stop_codon:yes gene_type:complete